jgi:hypothetical protein
MLMRFTISLTAIELYIYCYCCQEDKEEIFRIISRYLLKSKFMSDMKRCIGMEWSPKRTKMPEKQTIWSFYYAI